MELNWHKKRNEHFYLLVKQHDGNKSYSDTHQMQIDRAVKTDQGSIRLRNYKNKPDPLLILWISSITKIIITSRKLDQSVSKNTAVLPTTRKGEE